MYEKCGKKNKESDQVERGHILKNKENAQAAARPIIFTRWFFCLFGMTTDFFSFPSLFFSLSCFLCSRQRWMKIPGISSSTAFNNALMPYTPFYAAIHHQDLKPRTMKAAAGSGDACHPMLTETEEGTRQRPQWNLIQSCSRGKMTLSRCYKL